MPLQPVAAYADFTSQMLGMWARNIDMMTGAKPAPKSWYRHPDEADRTGSGAGLFNFGLLFAPMATAPQTPTVAGMMFNPFAPFTLWMKAWPLEGNPAAWPMAFAMMGAGVSRSVAYPLAEANTAAIDAVATAGKAVDDSFSSYRSNGGHANAQVLVQETSKAIAKAVLPMLPLGLQMMTPWMNMLEQMPRVA